MDTTLEPTCQDWDGLIRALPQGSIGDRDLAAWRQLTREELGLDTQRPIIATGHQTLLWHPGILAKYLAVDRFATPRGYATANLIVDQHVGAFGDIELPVRDAAGRLRSRAIRLTDHREQVPMARHDAFDASDARVPEDGALPSVNTGMQRIVTAINAHQDADNAALQMGEALGDLMRPWIERMTNVTTTQLAATTLSRVLLEQMADDPWQMAATYNAAVRAVPEGGVAPLLVRDDYVELPLWRIDADGRRKKAFDADVQRWLDESVDYTLLPRALYMTALMRLAMCDLFVHGTGGARYDRAMEHWIRAWQGVEVCPIAVVTATLRLPLGEAMPDSSLDDARRSYRRILHDPDRVEGAVSMSAGKAHWLEQINALDRRSPARREAFRNMHAWLHQQRTAHEGRVEHAMEALEQAEHGANERPVIERRTWAFPLYPDAMINSLAIAIEAGVGQGAATSDCA